MAGMREGKERARELREKKRGKRGRGNERGKG